RLLACEVSSHRLEALIVNVYAPNNPDERRRLLLELDDLLLNFHDPEKDIILIGDWNFVENPERDRVNSSLSDTVSKRIIESICSRLNLVDAWLAIKPEEVGHSWARSMGGNLQAARIDRAYISR